MPSITRLPKETVLEITKLLVLKDAVTLLRTCRTLHGILGYRPFWMDQIRGQTLQFKALIHLDFNALTLRELRQIATKPYRFERNIVKKKLRDASLTRLRPDIRAFVVTADIVPGGEWIVTLTLEWDTPLPPIPFSGSPYLRLWCISARIMKQFGCRATLALPTELIPTELCLQPDEVKHHLLVFVNGARRPDDDETGSMQVFQVDLSAASTQFSSLAILNTPRPSAGMIVHGSTVLTTTLNPETNQKEDVAWNWRSGQSVLIPSGDTLWSVTASQEKIVFWNDAQFSVDVHEVSAEGESGLDHRHESGFNLPPEHSQDMCPIGPTLIKPWNSADLHTFLVHAENATIRVDFANVEVEIFNFSRYPKDNAYMKDPDDPFSPHGSYVEVPSHFVKTCSGHLVDLSPSGRLTVYYAITGDDQPIAGESNTYHAFANFEDRVSGKHHPIICPFSGVAGTVTEQCDFYIWRMK